MKAKIKKLKNGLRIVTVPMAGNPTVTVLVMVAAGTRYETRETNGLSHFLEHMCFKGTKRRTVREIAYELESIGGQTNAFTGHDYTGYYAKGRAELFSKFLDIVADVYQNSTFPEKEIEKERGVVLGEINMYEDLPQKRVQEYFAESLYGDQPAGYRILGPKENIKRFSREDFLKYRDRHYVAGKTTIIVTGGIDSKQVEREVAKAFVSIPSGKIERKKRIASITGNRLISPDKRTDQTHIVMGLRGLPMGHSDLPAFSVMTGILGQGMSSRLFTRLREEMGAGYYVSASDSSSDDTGEFEIRIGTAPERVLEVVEAIMGEVVQISSEKVSHDELAKIQEFLVSGIYMGLESSDSVAFHAGYFAVLNEPIKMPKDIEKEIRKVSANDVLRVAKKYLVPSKFHLAMIGPKGDEKKLQKMLGT